MVILTTGRFFYYLVRWLQLGLKVEIKLKHLLGMQAQGHSYGNNSGYGRAAFPHLDPVYLFRFNACLGGQRLTG